MKNESKKINKKQLILLFITFLIGIIVSIFIFNKQNENRNTNVDINFIDSRQAIIFWTTKNDTIGFVNYGVSETNRDMQAYQTSSVAGKVHAVIIENIPIEGVYISLHNESDSPFLFSKSQRIFFDSSKYLE